MSSVIDFANALKTTIQAGQEVVEGNVVKIIADNGTELGNAVMNTVAGGNGVASNVYSMTGEVVGGTATTTGVCFMSVSLPTACAALAPVLGIVAGVGLYNLAPNFFDTVGNALYNAGETIGGKVIAYFDGDNIYFDENTIETFKNTLLELGVYDNANKINLDNLPFDLEEPVVALTTSVGGFKHINDPSPAYSNVLCDYAVYGVHTSTGLPGNYYYWGGRVYATDINTLNSINFKTTLFAQSENYVGYVLASDSHISFPVVAVACTEESFAGSGTGSGEMSTTYEGKTVYYRTVSFPIEDTQYQFVGTYVPYSTENTDVGKIAWALIYGTMNTNSNIQDDAILPNENPFPLTYPDYYPYNYPDTSTPDEPKIYPAKYPQTDPDPYPKQEPAQNPDPEDPEKTYPKIVPDLPLPDPNPDPYPEPSPDPSPDPDPTPDPDPYSPTDVDPYIPVNPDPTPQPDDPTPTPTPDDPIIPDPDPVNPNPDPITPTPIIDPSLPETISSNSLFTVYNPTLSQLNALGAYLWDSSLMETIKKIWMNPLDGIISLIQVYATPITSGAQNIILGYLDSGVSASVVSNQFVTIDCGTINVDEIKKNATDYAPYTSAHLYLPFIGIVELNINDFMNGSISVKYKVDVYTGTCLAQVKATRTKDMPTATTLYEFSGNCSQQIPLTSGNATGMLSALVAGAGAGLSIAMGGGIGVVAGASIIGNSLTHEMFHVSKSGNLSANAGIMGHKKPFLILSRRQGYDANSYNTLYGYPANKTVTLGNYSGFVRVKHCLLKTKATDKERLEITALLNAGVIF